MGHHPVRQVVADEFLPVQVHHGPVVPKEPHQQTGECQVRRHLELMPEIRGDRVRCLLLPDHGLLVPVPEPQLRRPRKPLPVRIRRVPPAFLEVGPVIPVPPGSRGRDEDEPARFGHLGHLDLTRRRHHLAAKGVRALRS